MSLAKKLAAKLAGSQPAQPQRAPAAPAQRPAAPSTQAAGLSPEVEAYIAQLEAERDETRGKLETERAKSSTRDREVEKLRGKLDETVAAGRRERMRAVAMQWAARHGAHDPEELADLTIARLSVTEKGDVMDAADPTKSGEETIKAYLEAKPHHRKSQAATGSGASPSPGTNVPPDKAPPPPGGGTPNDGFRRNLKAAQEAADASRAQRTTRN